jgi:hypothetical protein
MMTLILLSVLVQANKTVDRLEKNLYYEPVRDCRVAEELVESDPRAAVEKLDPIIANPKLQRNIEARVRIAEGAAQFSDWTLFLPYQFRGRARMNLARKAADPEAALRLAQGGVADLEESVRRGVAPSEEHLKAAKADLEKIKAAATAIKPPDVPATVKEDPAAKLRLAIAPLLLANRYKSARAAVDRDGKEVPEADRKQIAEDVDRRCRAWLSEEMFNFRRRFGRLEDLAELTEISDGAFDSIFGIPAPEEVSAVDPAYAWARSVRPVFKDVQARKAGAEALLPAAVAASALDDAAWFTRTESLAYQGVREGMRSRVERSLNLAKAEREALRSQAEALAGAYVKDFAGKLDPAFLQRTPDVKAHAAELQKLLSGFPADLAELGTIDLEAPLCGRAVEADLLTLENRLRSLESRGAISVESRRDLYTALVSVGALRALVAGKDEDGAAADVRSWAAKLAAAGGPTDVKRFGARVERVFGRLK